MKKLVCLIMVMVIGSVAWAGNIFTDATGDHLWNTVGNWSMAHVPNDSTTVPDVYVPQWGNDVGFATNARMDIGIGEDWNSFSLQLGQYGSDNTVLNLSGGSVTVGGWGMDVGRGNDGHGPMDGTVNMTGGVINTTALCVPQAWDDTPAVGSNVGVIYQSTGTINADFLRIGMGNGDGTVVLSGNAFVDLAYSLQMNVLGDGVTPSQSYGASLIIDDSAYLLIGGQGGGLPEDLVNELALYQTYIDLGWITSNTGTIAMSYNAASDTIAIVPEPATMVLLGLGGLLIRRKR